MWTICLACVLAFVTASPQAEGKSQLPDGPGVLAPAESVRANLAEAEREIGLAESLLSDGNADEARAAVQTARRKLAQARDGLRVIEVENGQRSKPVQAKLIQLVEDKLAEAEKESVKVNSLLNNGETVKARATLQAARQRLEEARDGHRLIENLSSRLRVFLSNSEDLSVLKVRILSTRTRIPHPSQLAEETAPHLKDDPRWRRIEVIAGSVYRLFHVDRIKNVDAEILEVDTVGKRYAARTVRGKQFPSEKRRDLRQGGMIELEHDPPDTGVGQMDEGRNYWIAITPPIASKAIPRAIGALGRTRIVFAMPTEQIETSPGGKRGPRSF